MARLTLKQISHESKDVAGATTSLNLCHRALSDVSCLSNFRNLERLDLSCNCLSSLEDLSSCVSLKWLSVVENKLETLKGVEGLSKLTVLNAGKNMLRTMDEVESVTSLLALILNDNKISSICKLDQLRFLNTLVLSRNPIHDIGDSLVKAKSITKLSLSYCLIENIGSSLVSCVDLKEARFAHNMITTLPPELARNRKLQNLDMGSNLIENWSDIKVISALHNLKNLNLQGNPIAEKAKLAKKVKKLVPDLRIFNAKSLQRRDKSETTGQAERSSRSKYYKFSPHASENEMTTKRNKKRQKLDVNFSTNIILTSDTQHVEGNKKEHAVVADGRLPEALVVDHAKRRKRSKSTSGALALQILPPTSQVGMGGPSAWDD